MEYLNLNTVCLSWKGMLWKSVIVFYVWYLIIEWKNWFSYILKLEFILFFPIKTLFQKPCNQTCLEDYTDWRYYIE